MGPRLRSILVLLKTGLYLTVVGCSTIVWASEEDLKSCTGLDESNDRLSCYDTVAGRTPTVIEPILVANEKEKELSLSPLAQSWHMVAQSDRGPFVLTAHRPTYILPLSFNSRPNDQDLSTRLMQEGVDEVEIKFQISGRARIVPRLFLPNGDLWLAYTQLSFWQAYNAEASAPFRETIFEPELIYSLSTAVQAGPALFSVFNIGYNHQSNGRSEPASRSWDRIMIGTLVDYKEISIWLRGWWKMPEQDKDDDNPDIEHYLGQAEMWLHYAWTDRLASLKLLNNLKSSDNITNIQLDYSRKLRDSPIKVYIQYYYGYGDGLIDYAHLNHRIGIGIKFTDWF